MNVLLVDDDQSLRKTFRFALETMGRKVLEAQNEAEALDLLSGRDFEICFLDLRLGSEHGLDVLSSLLRMSPGLSVVVMTAYATIETAVEAMRRGAADYLPKPFTPGQLRLILERVQQFRRIKAHVEELEEQVRSLVPEADLQSADGPMRKTLDMAFRVAPTEATVLICGESGTGKGVVARAIHAHSPRADAPLITVNCPSLSAELLESDLFGHVKGAFTGAVVDTVGKLSAAEGGTLFLDEIGDLPLALQPKLLRLLQEKRYERVGETKTRISNVRILAATNRNLQADVASGRFREDLFYRLNVIEIVVPPLRERRHDIEPLAEHLLRFFAKQTGRTIHGFTSEAKTALLQHAWPGNVRELRNAIERSVILSTGPTIGLADLPSHVGTAMPGGLIEVGRDVTLDQLEAEHVRRILGSKETLDDVATVLGIDPSTLYRKRKRYGL